MTCTGMYGSGWRTTGTTTTKAPLTTAPCGREASRLIAFCVAGPGTTIHSSSAQQFASGLNQTTAPTLSGCELPGRYDRRSGQVLPDASAYRSLSQVIISDG